MGLPEFLQLQRKTFLKASLSERSAPLAFDGLGTCGLIRAFLRYSQPRWGCTFSEPVLCAIQRATFGPLHIPPKLRLALLIQQRPLPRPGVGVATIAQGS